MANPLETSPEPEYITIKEAARRSSLSPRTLYNLISSGRLTYKHGLRRPGGNGASKIHWPTFKANYLDARGAF